MTTSDIRILRLIDVLIFEKKIGTASEFCDEIGLIRQNLTNIKKGKQHFTTKHIENMCKKYNVNANWIFATQNNVFNYPGSVEITSITPSRLPAI